MSILYFLDEIKSIRSRDKGGSTWYYEVDSGSRIPVEAHRVAQQLLRFRPLDPEVLAVMPAVANQGVDVVRQAQQLAIHIFQF